MYLGGGGFRAIRCCGQLAATQDITVNKVKHSIVLIVPACLLVVCGLAPFWQEALGWIKKV